MAINRGKQFEDVIRKSFEKVEGVSIDRIPDQTSGFLGSQNICDFIVYKEPYEYYFECKSVHGNTMSISSRPKPDRNGKLHGAYGNITDTQWEGLLEKSSIQGVQAGVIVWFIDLDKTIYIPIETLKDFKEWGFKSVSGREDLMGYYHIPGVKKRVFFDYDMLSFLKKLELREESRNERV